MTYSSIFETKENKQIEKGIRPCNLNYKYDENKKISGAMA